MDDYLWGTPDVRTFVAQARTITTQAESYAAARAALRPAFSILLADPDWPLHTFHQPVSSMGSGSATG